MLLRKPSSMPLKPSPLIGTSIRPRSLGQVSAVNAVVPPPCLPIPYLPLVLPLRAPFGLFMPPCVPLDPLVILAWSAHMQGSVNLFLDKIQEHDCDAWLKHLLHICDEMAQY